MIAPYVHDTERLWVFTAETAKAVAREARFQAELLRRSDPGLAQQAADLAADANRWAAEVQPDDPWVRVPDDSFTHHQRAIVRQAVWMFRMAGN